MTTPGMPMSLCPTLTRAGHGTVVCTRHYASQDDSSAPAYITIDHADPHIMVSDDLLHEVALGDVEGLHPCMRIDPPPDEDVTLPGRPHLDQWTAGSPWVSRHYHKFTDDPWCCKPEPSARCWVNWLLRIEGRNDTVVYRIRIYDQQLNAWRASWPD